MTQLTFVCNSTLPSARQLLLGEGAGGVSTRSLMKGAGKLEVFGGRRVDGSVVGGNRVVCW